MDKSPDAFRTISEVAEWLEVKPHVLRFWESKFKCVTPVKRGGGRRYYRPDIMLLIGGIKHLLYDQGLTIKGVNKLIDEQGIDHISALSKPLSEDISIDNEQHISSYTAADDAVGESIPDAPHMPPAPPPHDLQSDTAAPDEHARQVPANVTNDRPNDNELQTRIDFSALEGEIKPTDAPTPADEIADAPTDAPTNEMADTPTDRIADAFATSTPADEMADKPTDAPAPADEMTDAPAPDHSSNPQAQMDHPNAAPAAPEATRADHPHNTAQNFTTAAFFRARNAGHFHASKPQIDPIINRLAQLIETHRQNDPANSK